MRPISRRMNPLCRRLLALSFRSFENLSLAPYDRARTLLVPCRLVPEDIEMVWLIAQSFFSAALSVSSVQSAEADQVLCISVAGHHVALNSVLTGS